MIQLYLKFAKNSVLGDVLWLFFYFLYATLTFLFRDPIPLFVNRWPQKIEW